MEKAQLKNVVKNVMPSVMVLAAGLVGAMLVHNSYLSDDARRLNSLEPAAGPVISTKTVSYESRDPFSGIFPPQPDIVNNVVKQTSSDAAN